jgi:cytochrome c553
MKALVATVTDDEFAKIAKYLEAQGASTAPAAAPVAAAPATTTPAAVSVTTTTTTPAAK